MGYLIYIAIAGLFLSVHVIDSVYTLICEYKNTNNGLTALSVYAMMVGVSFIPYLLDFCLYCSHGSLTDMLLSLVLSALIFILMVIFNHTFVIPDYKNNLKQAKLVIKRKTIKF